MIYFMYYLLWAHNMYLTLNMFHIFQERYCPVQTQSFTQTILLRKKLMVWEDKNTIIMVFIRSWQAVKSFDVFLSLYAFRTFTFQNIFIRNIFDIWQGFLGPSIIRYISGITISTKNCLAWFKVYELLKKVDRFLKDE